MKAAALPISMGGERLAGKDRARLCRVPQPQAGQGCGARIKAATRHCKAYLSIRQAADAQTAATPIRQDGDAAKVTPLSWLEISQRAAYVAPGSRL
ncbi:MAG: hypothetical protein JOY71_02505 [Acetobacteraceae bacterium]|nr:hypothetical protein [Acetobacteraceae bacterium]